MKMNLRWMMIHFKLKTNDFIFKVLISKIILKIFYSTAIYTLASLYCSDSHFPSGVFAAPPLPKS